MEGWNRGTENSPSAKVTGDATLRETLLYAGHSVEDAESLSLRTNTFLTRAAVSFVIQLIQHFVCFFMYLFVGTLIQKEVLRFPLPKC